MSQCQALPDDCLTLTYAVWNWLVSYVSGSLCPSIYTQRDTESQKPERNGLVLERGSRIV
jgi:hypothetical protein